MGGQVAAGQAEVPNLRDSPVHLGKGGAAIAQPRFTGMEWYEGYIGRTAGDGADGRLVSFYDFCESWTSWEMHPAGAELVVCTAGRIVLIQQLADGSENKIALGSGDYAINPPGIWHTADVEETATALFITAGMGTEHRPR